MKSEKQFSQDKDNLRFEAKAFRNLLENKDELSQIICNNFISSDKYKNCKTLLCYLAFGDEVDTTAIISKAFEDKKTVGVPVCLDKNGKMEFFEINSFDDLHKGSFGINEPNASADKKIIDFDSAVIVVPGLCFDKNGNRLGYGKGYYDRYLQNHSLISFGLCYNGLVLDFVPTEIFDKSVDFVVSENQIINCNGGKNG